MPEHSPSSLLTSLDSAEKCSTISSPELEIPDLDLELSQFESETPSRYRKAEPITSTPTTPDYNLSAFFALAEPKHSMPTETPQIFHGDERKSENPADFLKLFNRAMQEQATIASNNKLEAFGDYLGTGSEAEVWFKGLTTTQTATWTTFVTVFEMWWPPMEIAKKTKADQERKLLEHRLTDADVGTKTTLYDRECWSHEAWATKAQQLATSAGIEVSTAMIWQVRGGLPNVIKDLLKDDEYKNWAEFTKEVKELKGNRLLEKKEQHSKQECEVNKLRADIARLQQRSTTQNPISAIQNQFSRMSIAPPKPYNMTTNNSTITRTPAQQMNQFTQQTISCQPATNPQPLIITEEMKNAT
ncbi:uncharacterized protein EDB91DRAFT_1245303 [Suillus paluster]|uniref:uncharacterized protein n=1 Tax=Suillus paluster TaxID=48578 RepID=UPI001B882289|nr:uncharacterized protein EDB91DRAFT_1245303 [Suillus paluster]KAG1747817.1 hypothetical protein EDB91DRAFT_1245303 [Suillus paluster]